MADDLMLSLDGGDWLGVVLATVAAFFVGFVWFTLLFGQRWAKEMGMEMDPEKRPGMGEMWPSMLKDVVGNFIMAYVLWHSIMVWIPSVWADHLDSIAGNTVTATDAAMWTYGIWAALFIWIGFFVPVSLSRTGWEGRSWSWFGIDTSYTLVKLLVMGQILAAFA